METNLFNLTPLQFQQILSSHLDLNTVYLLWCLDKGIATDEEVTSQKAKGYLQTLSRKGFIAESGTITVLGKEYLQSLTTQTSDLKAVIKTMHTKATESFDTWWSIFPGTDKFKVGSKVFEGSRGLRQKKDDCRELFKTLVNKGEYTAEEIIEATKLDIETRKKNSVKKSENTLKYLQNSYTYLNQRSFDGYVDDVRAGTRAGEGPTGKSKSVVDL
jgi:hypothetical protein